MTSQFRHVCLLLSSSVSAVTLGTSISLQPAAAAILPIFNTGVDATGSALPAPGSLDLHWRYQGVEAQTAVDPNQGWIANVTSGPEQSGWIGPNPATFDVGDYVYSQDFLVPAGATNLSLRGRWATDDSARLYLNGQEVLSAQTDGFASPAPWTIFQDFAVENASFFLPGATNRLEARILNTGGPTGFQAQFQGTYTPPVPGPLPLFGVAAAYASSRRWRQRARLQRIAPRRANLSIDPEPAIDASRGA
ncbi:MAG: hypothetical protein ACKOZW_07410 [Cyanobium sp.]